MCEIIDVGILDIETCLARTKGNSPCVLAAILDFEKETCFGKEFRKRLIMWDWTMDIGLI